MICPYCERVPVTGGMILPRAEVDHAAYRKGLCCDCSTVPYSPGRPRCHACHDAWMASQPIFTPQLDRKQLGRCARSGCSNPTTPGKVSCSPCTREKKGRAAS